MQLEVEALLHHAGAAFYVQLRVQIGARDDAPVPSSQANRHGNNIDAGECGHVERAAQAMHQRVKELRQQPLAV